MRDWDLGETKLDLSFLKKPSEKDKLESTKRLIKKVLSLNVDCNEIGSGMILQLRQLAMESENELQLNFHEGVEK